jgi:hypothetical protein
MGRAYVPTCDVASGILYERNKEGTRGCTEGRTETGGLEEEARRLKQGAHRYRRREALTRRDRRREREVLVEQLMKEQASD